MLLTSMRNGLIYFVFFPLREVEMTTGCEILHKRMKAPFWNTFISPTFISGTAAKGDGGRATGFVDRGATPLLVGVPDMVIEIITKTLDK